MISETMQAGWGTRALRVRWADRVWPVAVRRAEGLGPGADLEGERAVRTTRDERATVNAGSRTIRPMKTRREFKPGRRGFTLIELLVVISIIGILAGMLLPALASAKVKAKKARAATEIKHIEMAIGQYEADYHRMPASPPVRQVGAEADFTYGTFYFQEGSSRLLTQWGRPNGRPLPEIYTPKGASPIDYRTSNAELMYILRDVTEWPGPGGQMRPTVNTQHGLNPKRQGYLDVKQTDQTTSPGMGPDGVYRDPFGNPYIVSMDMNGDERCRDAFYGLPAVSLKTGNQGYNGLNRVDATSPFELNRTVMIWSLGPDGQVSFNANATAGANKDNILSW